MSNEGEKTPERWDADTVTESVDEAKFHVEFEERRLESQFQRAGWLVALDGVLLALAAGQAHELLDHASLLGPVGRWIAAAALLVAGVAVFASSLLALLAILKSKSYEWNLKNLGMLAENQSLKRPRSKVQRLFLMGLIERVDETRKGYHDVRRRLAFAYLALGTALVAAVLYVGVYSVRTVENPSTCSPAKSQGGRPSAVHQPVRLVDISRTKGDSKQDEREQREEEEERKEAKEQGQSCGR